MTDYILCNAHNYKNFKKYDEKLLNQCFDYLFMEFIMQIKRGEFFMAYNYLIQKIVKNL